jgi:hypothetical protein
MPNFVIESKVMRKGAGMIPKVILNLESGFRLRKDPPKSRSDMTMCFPRERGTPPLLDYLASGESKGWGGPHTLGAPLGPWKSCLNLR